MQARDEVGVLLLFHDLLKLERKPTARLSRRPQVNCMDLLAGDFNFVRFYDVLERM